ncbi:hypothetical protein [Rheinheimera salexigens]|uniref:Uncharacterized protein n=1 Tax=Rheinheimera salexigens TaxID=1628148 RepID=A0A1E7Q9F4_9GAMM|nr:hypothetical protein [Rheinheimera salexigens]OEY70638.1 hypothetical protein BI198_14500 [Rheinheimera salexigens]
MVGKTAFKFGLVGIACFMLGLVVAIMYQQYDYYKWQMKVKIHESIHVLEQLKQVDSYDAALLRIKRNVACEVENYQLRNQEAGFAVDQDFINSTMEQIKLSCDQ